MPVPKNSCKKKTKFEVADVFRIYGSSYRKAEAMTSKQHKVMSAIEACRTSHYGYRVDKCDACGYEEYDFNSCRDRHCPKCQGISRQKWVNTRLANLLPVAHYHVVFTLPHVFHEIISFNKQLVYEALFLSSSQSLLEFGRDPKWLGGELGFYGVLHTWGQKLWQHPHVHFIVPGGALSKDNGWVSPRYKNKFLFPVKALSKVFRGKFVEALKSAYHSGDLVIQESQGYLSREDEFEQWVHELVNRDWVVYCKRPFGSAEQVVRYVGRYTHRVAISNDRITEIKDGEVSFNYKDYKAEKVSWQTMTLPAHEFIRRFLLHVLPEGFHKIRHYGYLANGRYKKMVALIKELLGVDHDDNKAEAKDFKIKCPSCQAGSLWPIKIITRWGQVIVKSIIAFESEALLNTS